MQDTLLKIVILSRIQNVLLKRNLFDSKAIENLDERNKYVNTLEFLNKIGTVHSNLLKPVSKLLVPKKRCEFRLDDDLNSAN